MKEPLARFYHAPRRRKRRARIAAGMGMAALACMLLPAPANANELNLADRLMKNVEILRRMQSRGAAILIPAEFREAQDAHRQAMRHARAIVRLRALQSEIAKRRRAAEAAGRESLVEALDSLGRWTVLEIVEHDSAGVAVSETVDAVAHRFAVLRGVRWMLREVGYDAPERSGPDLPEAVRERARTYAAALEQTKEARRLLKAGRGDAVARTIRRASAQSKTEEAALWVHRTERPTLYPLAAWRR